MSAPVLTSATRSAIKRNIRVEDIICRLCRVQATKEEDRICEICKAIGKTAEPPVNEHAFWNGLQSGKVAATRFIFGLGA